MTTTHSPYVIPGLKVANFETIADAKRGKCLSLEIISLVVCEYFQVPEENLKSKLRTRDNYAWPRQVFHYLARKHSGASLLGIGTFTGGRDHTTVLHSIAKVECAELWHKKFPDPLWQHTQAVEYNLTAIAKKSTISQAVNYPLVRPKPVPVVIKKKKRVKETSVKPEKKIWNKDRHEFIKDRTLIKITGEAKFIAEGERLETNFCGGEFVRRIGSRRNGFWRWLILLDTTPIQLLTSMMHYTQYKRHGGFFISEEDIIIVP